MPCFTKPDIYSPEFREELAYTKICIVKLNDT